MANSAEPLQFPCLFPIKIMGLNDDSLLPEIVTIIARHVMNFNPKSDVAVKHSNKGTYLSITATIVATSKEQLDNIYMELHKHKLVKFML